ncbi:MAG TPA: aminopeptidase P family N-terminal domain-containing protein, partial [Sphingopyxis terrae]|nr:aminopeptidase P family N-terminal domain-containing protein [Sphingopyxis terrae]
MSTPDHADRLARLRAELARRGLDGFVVPISDEHMSEYVGAYAQRMAWLTGFGGSAGTAAVLPAKAAVFIDGRYKVQVRDQVDGSLYDYVGVPQSSVAEWLGANVSAGQKIGYDPWLHGIDWARGLAAALTAKDASLIAVDTNPIDAVWDDQPAPSAAPIAVYDTEQAGQSAADKRGVIADWLKAQGLDTTVMTALDSIAWTFNIRGEDVSHTPVGLAFALLHDDATADLFVAPEKITDAVRAHLGNSVRIHDRTAFEPALAALAGKPRRPSSRAGRPTARSRRSLPRSKVRAQRSRATATRRCCPRRSRTAPSLPAPAPRTSATASRSRASSNGWKRSRRRASSTNSARRRNCAPFATKAA